MTQQTAQELRSEGKTYQQIGLLLSCSQTQAYWLANPEKYAEDKLKARGRKKKYVPTEGRTKWTDDLQQKAEELINEGLTRKQVAAELGVSYSNVRYHTLDKVKEGSKINALNWYEENADKVKAQLKDKRQDPQFKEEYNKYILNRLETNANFRIKHNLRGRAQTAIKRQLGVKAFKSVELLGCSIQKVRDHLEAQFTEGMTWENYGRNGWHIDHIRPCDSFDLTDPEEQQKCFHYTNLQPLWEADNIRKSNHYV